MDVVASPLPDSIHPNNFLAKLWGLVNNPTIQAICWDRQGQVVIIDEHLFETQILFPGTNPLYSDDGLKISTFLSFCYQLIKYGFKKANPSMLDSDTGYSTECHYFFNSNFKRNHPELVSSLDVKIQPPRRHGQLRPGHDGRENYVIRGSSLLFGPTLRESAHPYYPSRAQAMTAHSGPPVPPFPPAVKWIPAPLSHHDPAVTSSNKIVVVQQGLLAPVDQGNYTFNAPNAQPGYYYPPLYQWYHQNLVAPHMIVSDLQTGLFSPHSHYQAGYPVNILCDSGPVRVATPINLSPTLAMISADNALYDNPSGTAEAHPFPDPIIVSVTGNADLATFGQQEASEERPEDAPAEVKASLFIVDLLKAFTFVFLKARLFARKDWARAFQQFATRNIHP